MVKVFSLECIQKEIADKGNSKMAQCLNVLVAKPPEFDPQGPHGERKEMSDKPKLSDHA